MDIAEGIKFEGRFFVVIRTGWYSRVRSMMMTICLDR